MQEYKEYLRDRAFSARTIDTYCRSVDKLGVYLEGLQVELNRLQQTDILVYLDTLRASGLCPASLRSELTGLKSYYTYLVAGGVIGSSPIRDLQMGKQGYSFNHPFLSAEELTDLYNGYATYSPQSYRNKVLLGMLIYQGLRSVELSALEVSDVALEKGQIYIRSQGKYLSRTLDLASIQIMRISDYIEDKRPRLLSYVGIESERLFLASGGSGKTANIQSKIIGELKNKGHLVGGFDQLHGSVIANWLKVYDIRKVSYMCGHRYLSSTQRYDLLDPQGLVAAVAQYHPL